MGGTEQQAVIDALRDILDDFPGILYEANTFLIERVDETISGYTAPVVVNIYGNDLNKLDGLAQQMAKVIRSVPGATDVQLRSPPGTPLLEIQLQPQQLLRWGVRPLDALEAIQIAYEGRVTGKNYSGNRVYDIAVTLDPALKRDITEVGKLPVKTLDGAIIELEKLALITQTSGRYNILHQGAQRIQTVTAHVSGGDLRTFMQQIRQAVHEQIEFDADTYPEFTGAAIEEAQASQQLILHSVMAGIGVLVLIYIAIGSFRHSLLVLVNLPFSLVGGVMAVLFTGSVLSVGSMVGFVTLFGITVRNSIMMVSHYQHLVEVEGESWDLHTVIRGAQERLPSILMTALVTALAMMPIAFDSDNPGREIMGPMAAIIIGGLASSTLLNLLILPAIMLNYGKFDGRKDRLL
jgi:Cu/Ag efflux pump CusA